MVSCWDFTETVDIRDSVKFVPIKLMDINKIESAPYICVIMTMEK